MQCVNCDSIDATRVIYMGFPMSYCENCQVLWGFWSWIPMLYFTGAFFAYEGSYFKALWTWIKETRV